MSQFDGADQRQPHPVIMQCLPAGQFDGADTQLRT